MDYGGNTDIWHATRWPAAASLAVQLRYFTALAAGATFGLRDCLVIRAKRLFVPRPANSKENVFPPENFTMFQRDKVGSGGANIPNVNYERYRYCPLAYILVILRLRVCRYPKTRDITAPLHT